jgi:hypothetical protein
MITGRGAEAPHYPNSWFPHMPNEGICGPPDLCRRLKPAGILIMITGRGAEAPHYPNSWFPHMPNEGICGPPDRAAG